MLSHHDNKDNIVLNVDVLLQNELILTQIFQTQIISHFDKQKIFFRLAKSNKYQPLSQIISQVTDLNAMKDGDGNYAIHFAVKNHNAEMLKKLIVHNANYNVKNKMGDTPLDIALMSGDFECASVILNYENPEFRNSTAYLTKIIEKNNIDLLTLLFPLKKTWDSAHSLFPPLHAAVANNNVKIVEMLSKNLSLVNEVDHEGRTALDVAFRCQAERKSYSDQNTEILCTLLEAEEQEKLRKAIENKDWDSQIKYLTVSRIKTFIPTLLDNENKDRLKGNIDVKGEEKKPVERKDYIYCRTQDLNSLQLLNSWKDECQRSFLEMKSNTSLGIHVLNIIKKRIAEEYSEYNATFKMDLYCLYQSLKLAIESSTNNAELKEKIINIFALREDAILNSGMDYCYSKSARANKICYDIALLFCDKDTTPYQYLLKKARTDERVWLNPVEFTEELPDASKFIRVGNNEIHLTEYIVDQAIQRLKQGKTHSDHLWFGTDNKNIQPVPPLTQSTLQLLKQRSKTLNLLMEYIKRLENVAKKSHSVYTKLMYFKDALFSNSTHNKDSKDSKATLESADERLNPLLVDIGEWWNTLDSNIRNQIKELRGGPPHYRSIAEVTDIIFSVQDAKNHKRQTDIRYCIGLKAEMLEDILKDKNVKDKLQKISQDLEVSTATVSDQVLDEWQKAIYRELEEDQDIFVPTSGSFPQLSKSISIFLMKKMGYQFISGKKDAEDINKFISLILNESDLNTLKMIAELLLKPEYSEYRKNNFIETFIWLFNNTVQVEYEVFKKERDLYPKIIMTKKENVTKFLHWSVSHEKIMFIVYLMKTWDINPYDKYNNDKSYVEYFRENYSAKSLQQLYKYMSETTNFILLSIINNDLPTSKMLIDLTTQNNSSFLLIEAIRAEKTEIVEYILAKDNSVDFARAFTVAREINNPTIMQKMFGFCTTHANTILRNLEKTNDLEVYENLFQVPFEERRDWHDITARTNHLIHYVVINNNLLLLNKLFEKKTDVNIVNGAGQTALDIAILKTDRKLVELLLKQGANRCQKPEEYFIHLIHTSLDTRLLNLFLQNINLHIGYKDNNKTAFHYALERGPDFYPFVDTILNKIPPDRRKLYLNGSLTEAMLANDKTTITFLLSRGAIDESSYSQQYFTKLLKEDDFELATLLMTSKDIPFEYKNEERDTALHHAVEKGSLPIVLKILQNLTGEYQKTLQTVLNLALDNNQPEIVKALLLRGAIPDKNIPQYFVQNIHKMDPSFMPILFRVMSESKLSDEKTVKDIKEDNLRDIVLRAKVLPEAKTSNNMWYKEYHALREGSEMKDKGPSLFSRLYQKCKVDIFTTLMILKNDDYSKKFSPDFFQVFNAMLDKLVLDYNRMDLHELTYIYHFLQPFIYIPSVTWDNPTEIADKIFQIIFAQKQDEIGTRFGFMENPFSLVNQFCYQIANEILPTGNTLLSLLATPGTRKKYMSGKFENSLFTSLFDFVYIANESGGFENRFKDRGEVQFLLDYIFSEPANECLDELHTQIKFIAKYCKSQVEMENLQWVCKALALQMMKNTVNQHPDDLQKALNECFVKYPFIENYHYQTGNWLRTAVPLSQLFKMPKKISEDFEILNKEIQGLRRRS